MPTITPTAVLSKVKIILQDTTNIRWADTELLGWLNDGQREICAIRPDASTTLASVAMVSGTKQAIPATGISIIKVIRNMGAGGATPGQAIRKIPIELLDSTTPGWHAVTPVATIQHYMSDSRMPRNYYVYPPSNGTTQVELLYSSAPTDASLSTGTINVDDNYSVPLIDYIAYRAYAKDNDMIGNVERAAAHRKLFSDFMTARAQVDGAVNATKDNVAG